MGFNLKSAPNGRHRCHLSIYAFCYTKPISCINRGEFGNKMQEMSTQQPTFNRLTVQDQPGQCLKKKASRENESITAEHKNPLSK